MKWKDERRNSVGTQWGKAPSLVEGIQAEIGFPSGVKVTGAWALDEKGARGKEVPVETRDDQRPRLRISREYRTLWYLVEARYASSAAASKRDIGVCGSITACSVFPAEGER